MFPVFDFLKIRFRNNVISPPNELQYPPEIDVDEFDWGVYDTAGLPTVITPGSVFIDASHQTPTDSGDRGGGEIMCLADESKRKFQTFYPRHCVFNADDTWMKFQSADSWDSNQNKYIGGAQAFVPVATAGDPNTYFYTGVDGGGFWSNVDPNKLYVLINNDSGASNLRIQTLGVPYTGNEPIIHTFTPQYDDVGWGMNEGNMSWDDRFMAFNCTRVSDGQPIAVILDIQDCLQNPNGPNNIWSTMEIADDGGSLIDWISVSPSGDYFIIAYFGSYTLNPISGNAIIVYDNTQGSPSLKTDISKTNSNGDIVLGCAVLQESHSALAIDQDGNDVWVGYKRNQGCNADGEEAQGGCMEYDESTFVIMARFLDGAVKYLFSDTGNPRGYYTGYISSCNTKRPGWAYLSEGGRTTSGVASTDVFALKLSWDDILSPDGNIMQYFGRSYAEENFNPTSIDGSPNFDTQGTANRSGTMVVFDSYFLDNYLYGLHEPSPANEQGDMGRNQGTAFLLKWPQT